MYTIELFAELEQFQIRNHTCNASLTKAEKYERDFDAWKKANGFDIRLDADDLACEFRANLSQTQLDTYYAL